MKRIFTLVLGLGLSLSLAAQQHGPVIPIDSIFYTSPQNLQNGNDAPMYFDYGDTVTFEGVVLPLHPGFSSLSTSFSQVFVQDPTKDRWAAALCLAWADGDDKMEFANRIKLYENCIPGLKVKLTGTLSSFNMEQQINLLDVETEVVDLNKNPIEPTVLTIDSFKNLDGTDRLVSGEPYEHMYVEFQNVTVVDVAFKNSDETRYTWSLQDANGYKIEIYDPSRYYRNDDRADSTLPETFMFEPPATGTVLESIRGIITHGQSGYMLSPLVPEDVTVGEVVPPTISGTTYSPVVPSSSDDISVSANITDDGSVDTAIIHYAIGMDGTNWMTVGMENVDGDDWSGSIPSQENGDIIKYYIEAVDNDDNSQFSPNQTGLNNYIVVVDGGLTKVSQIQNTLRTDGASIYTNQTIDNMVLDVFVTATLDYLGEATVQDLGDSYSGIFIEAQAGDGVSDWKRGDLIQITGATVIEDFGVTYLSDIEYEVVSSGNPVPNPIKNVNLDSIAAGVSHFTEAYEGMLLEWNDVVVNDTAPDFPNYYGEWAFGPDTNDGSPSIRVDDVSNYLESNFAQDSLDINQQLTYLRGIWYYSFGNWKLLPRDKNDIAGFRTIYPDNVAEINAHIGLNVFPNPTTNRAVLSIEDESLKMERIQVRVLNLSGKEVMATNMSNGRLELDLSTLADGSYFIQLQANDLTTVVKLMKQ